jgi:hypothetical protein
MSTLLRSSISAAIVLAISSTAHAQWTVIQMGPGTRLYGIHGGQQVGISGNDAAVWYGSPASIVNLGPGSALATDGVQQVGTTPYSLGNHASLWSGTAGSYVDLSPDAYLTATAAGVDAGVQCGYTSHIATGALMWTGTANSVVPLSPPTPSSTVLALGVHAGQVVGWFAWSTSHHAVLWNPAAPALDLNPTGFAGESEALGVHAGTQVGWAGNPKHAGLWTGTAASFVDLHPAGATQSIARAVHGTVQVGEATIGGVAHASLWNGTSGSWIDLHAFVPPGNTSSVATGVWVDDNGVVYVCGYSNTQGLLWVDATNAITSYCFGDGSGTPCPCGNDALLGSGTGCKHSLGFGGKLATSGTASVSNDTLVLQGSQMPTTSSTLYFQGTSQQNNGAGAVFGDGLRCVSGAVIRLGTKLNAGGGSSFPDVGDPSISVKGQITQPGVTRNYQVWYRNIQSYCTPSPFNLTNGIAASWIP